MENFSYPYNNYINRAGIQFANVQKLKPISNPYINNFYSTISYSDNSYTNYGVYSISNRNTYLPIKTTQNNSHISYGISEPNYNSGIYQTTSTYIPHNYSNAFTIPTTSYDYNKNSLNINNINNTTYNPMQIYQTNSNFSYPSIINTNRYNIISQRQYTPSMNILESTAASIIPNDYRWFSRPIVYKINPTPINYSNKIINNNDIIYKSGTGRYNPRIFQSYEPIKTNLISQLRNNYFNENNLPYSIFSYEPDKPSSNHSLFSNDFMNDSPNIYPKYGINSVPISNSQGPEIETEIYPVEEIEYIPVKTKKLKKRTTIRYPKRKPIPMPRKLLNPIPFKKQYYLPKDRIHLKRISSPKREYYITTQEITRPVSPIRNISKLEPLSPMSSYDLDGGDYPYDNYNRNKVYSPRIYKSNLNTRKFRNKKYY